LAAVIGSEWDSETETFVALPLSDHLNWQLDQQALLPIQHGGCNGDPPGGGVSIDHQELRLHQGVTHLAVDQVEAQIGAAEEGDVGHGYRKAPG
jgi:hypothetical protein